MIIHWTCRHLTFPTNSTSLQNMAFSKYILYILKTCRSKVKWSNYSNITKINKQYQILAEFLLYFAAKLKMNINVRWFFFKSQLHTFYVLKFFFIKPKKRKGNWFLLFVYSDESQLGKLQRFAQAFIDTKRKMRAYSTRLFFLISFYFLNNL